MEICTGEDLNNRRVVHSDGRQWTKVVGHYEKGTAIIHDNAESTPWTIALAEAVSARLVSDADLEAIRTTVKSCCAAGACATACLGDCSKKAFSDVPEKAL